LMILAAENSHGGLRQQYSGPADETPHPLKTLVALGWHSGGHAIEIDFFVRTKRPSFSPPDNRLLGVCLTLRPRAGLMSGLGAGVLESSADHASFGTVCGMRLMKPQRTRRTRLRSRAAAEIECGGGAWPVLFGGRRRRPPAPNIMQAIEHREEQTHADRSAGLRLQYGRWQGS